MPAASSSRLGPGSRAFVRGSNEPVLIVRKLAAKSWEVERLSKSNGSRTGQLMNRTSYQLRKVQEDDRFPGLDSCRAAGHPAQERQRTATTTTTTTRTATDAHQQHEPTTASNEEVVPPSVVGNESQEGERHQMRIEELGRGNNHQQANENGVQEQQQQQQRLEGSGDRDTEGVEVVALLVNHQPNDSSNSQQRQDEENRHDDENENNSSLQQQIVMHQVPGRTTMEQQQARTQAAPINGPTQAMDECAPDTNDTVPHARTLVSGGEQGVVETVLLTGDDSTVSSGDSIGAIGEEEPQETSNVDAATNQDRIHHRTNEEDEMSDVSLDDFFNSMEDFSFLFSDDDDAIDPNSVALANELESREVHRAKYKKYIQRKRELVTQNWTACLEPPSENGVDIGDRVCERKGNHPRYGIVVEKHPDSIPGTPLSDVLFDDEAEIVRALSSRRDIKKIIDNRSFTWQIVEGDSTPDDPVKEFEQVGVVGFNFESAFSHANVSSENPNYNFPFLRLLMHMWPGESLIAAFCVT